MFRPLLHGLSLVVEQDPLTDGEGPSSGPYLPQLSPPQPVLGVRLDEGESALRANVDLAREA